MITLFALGALKLPNLHGREVVMRGSGEPSMIVAPEAVVPQLDAAAAVTRTQEVVHDATAFRFVELEPGLALTPIPLDTSTVSTQLEVRTRPMGIVAAVLFAAAAAATQRSALLPLLSWLWHLYEAAAVARPLITKAVTSGVAYIAGDAIAQRMARTRDGSRLARAAIAGTFSHGPQLHYWTLLLDRLPLNLVSKVALDQTVFSLYLNAAFCLLTEALQRRPIGGALQSARASAWPCLKAGWKFWPFAHLLTYSVVPLHLRVLWVDALEIAWVAILSTCVARNANSDEPPVVSS